MERTRPNGLSRRWDLGGRAGPIVAGAVGEVGGASGAGRIFVPVGETLVLVPGRFCWRLGICAGRNSSDGFHRAGPREMPTCLQKSEHYERKHRSASPLSPTWSGGPGLESDRPRHPRGRGRGVRGSHSVCSGSERPQGTCSFWSGVSWRKLPFARQNRFLEFGGDLMTQNLSTLQFLRI